MSWKGRKKIHGLRRDDRGVAIVELAIALPILMVVLLGIVEFGRVMVYWNDTTQISSIGARWAVVNRWPGQGTVSLQDAIKNEVPAQQGFSDLANQLSACVEFIDTDADGVRDEIGDAVRVTTIFTFEWTFIPSWIDMADRDIVTHATMRIENLPTYVEADNHPECP